MTSRLDRLLLLLDTGSSTTVRHTAARQLAQLAAKSVAGDVANVGLEEDLKSPSDPSISQTIGSANVSTRLHVHGSGSQGQRDPAAWRELMAVVAKILPYLHSKSHETRSAASTTLSHIFTLVPLWQPLSPLDNDIIQDPSEPLIPPYPSFSLPTLLSPSSKLLLASSGKEFTKPTGILGSTAEVKRARKEAMSRLGLEFLDNFADELDIEKELAGDELDVEMEFDNNNPPSSNDRNLRVKVEDLPLEPPVDIASSSTAKSPSPIASSPVDTGGDLSALSARERNRLKRKRKAGNAFVAAPPPPPPGSAAKYNPTAAGNKVRLVATSDNKPPKSRIDSSTPPPTDEQVIIDPSQGGAIAPTAQSSFKALEVPEGTWVWDGLAKVLEVDLFSAAWQVRHGAAMALRELIKVQGANGGRKDGLSEETNELSHEKWCNELSAQFLCVLALDRFGDFVSDQVVAPVRETVSQSLASLLIHMPKRSVLHVHSILKEMIQQNFQPAAEGTATSLTSVSTRSRPKAKQLSPQKDTAGLVWEVRHAGLLGIKYEVAVRNDLFEPVAKKEELQLHSEDVHMNSDDEDGKFLIRDVVECAVQGLGDRDDDVRAVAATCLIPVAAPIVHRLPESLQNILLVLYGCLCDMKDDLSSSVGAVMDLLGKLVAYDRVIDLLATDTVTLPLTTLAPSLFPFFRHTIPNVRLAVVKTLHSFMAVPTLPRSWISAPLLQLLFQNMIVEERMDIRNASLEAWTLALRIASSPSKNEDVSMDGIAAQHPSPCMPIEQLVSQVLLLQWFTMLMTPIGMAIDSSYFYQPAMNGVDQADDGRERHNVDKNMVNQDLALVTAEATMKARLISAIAIAKLMMSWPHASMEPIFSHFLNHYIDSTSMLQKLLSAVIAEEWAHESQGIEPPLLKQHAFALALTQKMLLWLRSDVPAAYHEMAFGLSRIHYECSALLQSFSTDCKLPMSSIPTLGTEIDITGQGLGQDVFTLETAKKALGPMYTQLKSMLGKTKKKELAAMAERRTKVQMNIERYADLKGQHDNRVAAAFASAFVTFTPPVDKVGPIVKGIMNGVKSEENFDLQERFASAVASFVDLFSEGRATARDKIISNLCTFICSDASKTPTWVYSNSQLEGILSFQGHKSSERSSKELKELKDVEGLKLDETDKASLSRRGSIMALHKLSVRFGADLFDRVPNMWNAMTGGLLGTIKSSSLSESDLALEKHGQNVIDSLSVLEAVTPTLHASNWNKLAELFPVLTIALRSRFAIIRQLAARSFSTICDVMTPQAMRFVVEHVVPLLGDPLSLTNREGATELMYHLVQKLDIKALPYVIFLVVPVLGRMSDSSDDIRATSTNTFASLVKMIPLEAGLPDPPDFPDDLLKKRDTEREFLTQLLDGSKVQPYKIPVTINAELRPYQQDGVNWLAFLAKYQLHGILCDDMGLGKTLQSICILASKHHERSRKNEETKTPDSVHLPSLIVCPPTLSGHWFYEILKYAVNLKPFMYVGSAKERTRHIPKLKNYDVVITSYEVVRNDISNLEKVDWLYCILDEGHVIKNAKTKLTKAVKLLKAQHRLILSGTPIQNNVLELWSLFDFLMPGFLGTEHLFNERFSKPILANRDGKAKNGEAAALALEALHKQVLPFLLRRLKEDVLHDLPPKIIQDYYCDLSDLQKNLYDDFARSRALASAEGSLQDTSQPSNGSGGGGKGSQHIFQALQYLRKLCNHPALVLKDDNDAITAALEKVKSDGDGLKDIRHAPKLLALKQLLLDCGIGIGAQAAEIGKSEIIETEDSGSSFSQHRVLIFCQMKQMLDIIEKDLFKRHMPSVTYMRLDGGTDTTKRHNIVQTFNADPTIDCLLLTTHVGGLGLTLTGADTVIFVEHDWNPMKDLQAMDRAHRIGQKKVVNVYRLVTKGTLEEKIMGLQRFKINIANSIVTQQNSGLSSMDTDQVLDLFKRTSDEEASLALAKRKAKEQTVPISQKNALDGLEDLPPEDEYENLDLSSFMGSLGRK